jgi:ATP-dependent 26S proteasome regulatory subunit
VVKDETHRLSLEHEATREKIKENQEKIKLNKQLPYLVGNVVEVLNFLASFLQPKINACHSHLNLVRGTTSS